MHPHVCEHARWKRDKHTSTLPRVVSLFSFWDPLSLSSELFPSYSLIYLGLIDLPNRFQILSWNQFYYETSFGFVVQIKWTVCWWDVNCVTVAAIWEMFPVVCVWGAIFQVYSIEQFSHENYTNYGHIPIQSAESEIVISLAIGSSNDGRPRPFSNLRSLTATATLSIGLELAETLTLAFVVRRL